MSVMVVEGPFGEVIVPLPLITVHCPVAGATGVVPVTVTMFADVGTQMLSSALTVIAGCALSYTVIATSSKVLPFAQGPLDTDQRNTFTPTGMLFTAVLGLLGVTMVPPPLTKVHVPDAGSMMLLPESTVELASEQSSWSGPALATGLLLLKTRMRTSSVVVGFAQAPLSTVQRKILSPTARPVICVVGLFGDTIVPDPLINVQVPVAGAITALPTRFVEVVGVQSSWSGPALAMALAEL